MDIFKFIKDYPEIGTLCIATFFTALGFIIKSLLSFYLEEYKRKNEIKDFFWKEKIQSAKKATEYYLHHMSLITLIGSRYEMFENENTENDELVKKIEQLIEIYREKLLDFPHYEHHHINLFYDFTNDEFSAIQKSDIEANQKINSLTFNDKDTLEVINKKIELAKQNFKILKNNSQLIFDIYKNYLQTIREDIKNYTK